MKPGAARHDWSARARSTAMDALRYTQFVGVMKRALPTAAFAIIAAVLVFFFVARQPPASHLAMNYQKLGASGGELAMIKPKLTGADAKGHPFTITAEAAIQDAKHPKRARLKQLEADIALDKGWVNAEATGGFVDMDAGTLELNGGISVYSDAGYELHTKAASVDLNQGVVHGHNEVTGQGPSGTLRADQFHFDRAAGQLLLEGHVQMVLTGTRK